MVLFIFRKRLTKRNSRNLFESEQKLRELKTGYIRIWIPKRLKRQKRNLVQLTKSENRFQENSA